MQQVGERDLAAGILGGPFASRSRSVDRQLALAYADADQGVQDALGHRPPVLRGVGGEAIAITLGDDRTPVHDQQRTGVAWPLGVGFEEGLLHGLRQAVCGACVRRYCALCALCAIGRDHAGRRFLGRALGGPIGRWWRCGRTPVRRHGPQLLRSDADCQTAAEPVAKHRGPLYQAAEQRNGHLPRALVDVGVEGHQLGEQVGPLDVGGVPAADEDPEHIILALMPAATAANRHVRRAGRAAAMLATPTTMAPTISPVRVRLVSDLSPSSRAVSDTPAC